MELLLVENTDSRICSKELGWRQRIKSRKNLTPDMVLDKAEHV